MKYMEQRIDDSVFLLGEQLKRQVKLRPNHEFLVDWVTGKGERRLTYKQAAEEVYRLCWALKDLGVKKGDMIASMSYTSVELIEFQLVGSLIGTVHGCQNPDLPDDWLVTIINDTMAAKVLFFDDEYRDKVKRLMPKFKAVQHYICFDGPSEGANIVNYHELIAKYEPKEAKVEVEPDDMMYLAMSTGTTGCPKAAIWTHRGAFWNGLNGVEIIEIGTDCPISVVAPFFWSIYFGYLLPGGVMTGNKFVLFRGKIFAPGALELLCEAVGKEKIGVGEAMAAWYMERSRWSDEKAKQYDLSTYNPTVFGISVPYSAWKGHYDKWGITGNYTSWSSCEGAGGIHFTSSTTRRFVQEGREKELTSIGYPFGGVMVLKIVDAEENEVGPNEVGELTVKGPSMAVGYVGEPERWARKYDAKTGWLHTGDLYTRDESGYFYMVAKKEDIGMFPVDKEGKFVLPYPIQNAVANMENAVESALIAVSDPEYKAKYRIVARPKEGVEMSPDEVMKVAAKVAPDYVIKDVIIRKEPITKTATGKILVRALAEEYGGILPEE